LKKSKRRGGKGKGKLTTTETEVKCGVDKGVAHDDELWDGMASNSGTRNDVRNSLGE